VRDAAGGSTEREREATAIERDADGVCAAFLLGRELFERGWKQAFEGEVSGVIGAGAFVHFGGELGDAYEGLLPVRLMRDDHFDLNETETALVGRRSKREIRLGDPVSVKVDRVEAPRGRVDLVPAEDEKPRRKGAGGRRRERR
jgi:ribonuclease R